MGKLTKPEMRAADIVNAMIDRSVRGATRYEVSYTMTVQEIARTHGLTEQQAREAVNVAAERDWLTGSNYAGARSTHWRPTALAWARRIREMQDALHRIKDEARDRDIVPRSLTDAVTRAIEAYCDEASETRFAEVRMRERQAFDGLVRALAEENRNRRD